MRERLRPTVDFRRAGRHHGADVDHLQALVVDSFDPIGDLNARSFMEVHGVRAAVDEPDVDGGRELRHGDELIAGMLRDELTEVGNDGGVRHCEVWRCEDEPAKVWVELLSHRSGGCHDLYGIGGRGVGGSAIRVEQARNRVDHKEFSGDVVVAGVDSEGRIGEQARVVRNVEVDVPWHDQRTDAVVVEQAHSACGDAIIADPHVGRAGDGWQGFTDLQGSCGEQVREVFLEIGFCCRCWVERVVRADE